MNRSDFDRALFEGDTADLREALAEVAWSRARRACGLGPDDPPLSRHEDTVTDEQRAEYGAQLVWLSRALAELKAEHHRLDEWLAKPEIAAAKAEADAAWESARARQRRRQTNVVPIRPGGGTMTTGDAATGHPALPREAKRQLAIVAVHLWRSLLIGDPPTYTEALWQRMKNPRPGDLVMDDSTINWLIHRDPDLADDRWDGQLVPFLREEWRPMPVPADWEPGDPPTRVPPEERVLICQNPDGTEFAWTNAELLAVPTSLDWLEEE